MTALQFDESNAYLLSSGDRKIHVFHNIVGLKQHLVDLEEKSAKTQNEGIRRRVTEQITQAR